MKREPCDASSFYMMLLLLTASVANSQNADALNACTIGTDPFKAIEGCAAVIAQGESVPASVRAQAHFKRAQWRHRLGLHDGPEIRKRNLPIIVADIDESLRLDPKAEPYVLRGQILHESDPDRAFSDYSEAIRLNPRDASAFFGRGSLYKSKGNSNSALADLSRSIELKPSYGAAGWNVSRSRVFGPSKRPGIHEMRGG